MNRKVRYLAVLFLSVMGATGTAVQATLVNVLVDTSSLAGTDAVIAFDFLNGGFASGSNQVIIDNFATDGTLGSIDLVGDASGSLDGGAATLGDDDFFNSITQSLFLGNWFSFDLNATANGPFVFSPDAFSVFLLGPNLLPLVETDDPTGADALLALEIDSASAAPTAFASPDVSVTIREIISVPEPSSTLLLLVTGFGLLLWRQRRRSVPA